jgi:Cu+-exporting ATPase
MGRNMNMNAVILDPVCWMDVALKSVAGTSEYKGQTYYFCSSGCKETFDRNPEEYLDETYENEPNPEPIV